MRWALTTPSSTKLEFPMGILADFVVSTATGREGLEPAITKDEGTDKADPNYHLLKQSYAVMENIGFVPGSHWHKANLPGNVFVPPRDLADHPVIEPNYLDTEVDSYVWQQGPRTIARGMTGPTTASMFHGSGSCAMGAVVDSELRAKGVYYLWVVDPSVFTISIGAHMHAALYALAENVAVIISQQSVIDQ
ncbi:hypothetical protein DL765_005356 [Monosporascus sp. GIB2]|nr:hypothetical protein DL765_005356 [Monosporascus sp. GIB2]